MSKETRSSHEPSAAQSKRLVYWLLLVVILLVSWRLLGTLTPALLAVFVPILLAGGAALLLTRAGSRQREASRLLTRANAAIVDGRSDEAERLLDEHDRSAAPRADSAALLRATIALRRAELDVAERWLATALERRPSWRGRREPDEVVHAALGLSALVHAALGRDEAVRGDLAQVEAIEDAPGELRARVALAQMVMASHDHDDDRLRRLSAAHRSLLGAALQGRERALARALTRQGYAALGGAYRSAALSSSDGSELTRWVAAVAPRALGHLSRVGQTLGGVPTHLPEPSDAARAACDRAHHQLTTLRPVGAGARSGRVVWWLLMIGLFALVFYTARLRWLAALAVVLAVVGVFVWQLRRALVTMRRWKRLELAKAALRSDAQQAQRRLEALAAEPIGNLLAAAVELASAELCWLRAEPEQALAACDRALARVNSVESGESSLEPDDVSIAPWLRQSASRLRAPLLAALDRVDEAVAELEHAGDDGAAAYRVALIAALRRQAWDDAAALVAAHPIDAPLTSEDELLGDLAVLAAGRGEQADRHRVQDQLRAEPWLAAFAAGVAPQLPAAAVEDPSAG